MTIPSVGIGAYVSAMHNRMGMRNSQLNPSDDTGINKGTSQALLVKNAAAPEKAQDEGKTAADTKIPPPNDVGKLMDFKV